MAFVRSRQKKLADVSRSTIRMFEALEARRLLAGDGLKAEYFDNPDFTGLSVARVDSNVNFQWEYDSPEATLEPTTFSARWTGRSNLSSPRVTPSPPPATTAFACG